MKKRIFLLLTLSCLLLFTGCQKKNSQQQELVAKINLDMTDTLYQITLQAKFESTFEVDGDYLSTKYQWDGDNQIEVIGLFGSVLDSNRVLLFQVHTQQQKDTVFAYLPVLQEKLKATFFEGLDEEMKWLDSAITMDEGTYILFISGPNCQLGANQFDLLCSEATKTN